MKKSEIQIGETYVVKVSGQLAPVKIVSMSPYGGWNGVNVRTKRDVRIKTAGRIRRVCVWAPDPNVERTVYVPLVDETEVGS